MIGFQQSRSQTMQSTDLHISVASVRPRTSTRLPVSTKAERELRDKELRLRIEKHKFERARLRQQRVATTVLEQGVQSFLTRRRVRPRAA